MIDFNNQRPNKAMTAAVEAGIQLLASEGRAAAVAYLVAAGVPDRVIARVLCEPGRRRKM